MGRHRAPEPEIEPTPAPDPVPAPVAEEAPPSRRPGPVAVAAAIQSVLAVLVTLGWLRLDDETIATVATVAAGAVVLVVTLIARSKVTPVAAPRNADGVPLIPAA